MKKIITVFGSSIPRPGDEEYEFAFELGKQLASKNFSVCTGGYQGIMDAVSRGASEYGGEAFGITCKQFNAVPSRYLSTEIKTDHLFERITKLIEMGNGFAVLRGGTGTLLELSSVWELINKNLIERKPVVCNGDMWINILDSMEERTRLEKRRAGLIKFCRSVDECVEFLSAQLL